MTRPEIRAYAGTLGGALAIILLILTAQGLTDKIDRDTDARLAYRQWVADACTPAAGQTAVATHDGQRLHCTLYSRAAPGMARQIISAAVMEPPQ